jgi:hypothetical protein
MFRLRVGVPVVAAFLLAGGWLLGEDPKKADPEPVGKAGTLPPGWKKLGLEDRQVREVRRIRGTYAAKIAALQQKIDELKEEEKGELEKVLTDAQKARLKEIKLGETSKPKDDKDTKDKAPEKPPETTATKKPADK